MQKARDMIHEEVYKGRKLEEVIENLNPRRGVWYNYYKGSVHCKPVFVQMDHYIWKRKDQWEAHKYGTMGAKERLEKRDGKRTWSTTRGLTRVQGADIRPEYPSFPKLHAWCKDRKIYNPYINPRPRD